MECPFLGNKISAGLCCVNGERSEAPLKDAMQYSPADIVCYEK